jgi:hypothetical protein
MGFAEAIHGSFHHLEPAAVAVRRTRPAEEEPGGLMGEGAAMVLDDRLACLMEDG